MPFGTSLGLEKRQRSLERLLFQCFRLLWICVEGNGACIVVCNGAGGVLQIAMGRKPGQAAHLLARRPALTNTNVRFNVFSFIFSVCSTLVWKEMGDVLRFAMGLAVLYKWRWQDAGPGNAPFGASPGLAKLQRSL